jgi:hypothetical protein
MAGAGGPKQRHPFISFFSRQFAALLSDLTSNHEFCANHNAPMPLPNASPDAFATRILTSSTNVSKLPVPHEWGARYVNAVDQNSFHRRTWHKKVLV